VAVDTRTPQPERWQTLVPEGPDVLEAATGGRVRDCSEDDARRGQPRAGLREGRGRALGEIPLPGSGLGSVGSLSGRVDEPELFYSFTSFTTPPTIFRHDLATGKSETFRAPAATFDPSLYESNKSSTNPRTGRGCRCLSRTKKA